jgi:hypothetical protein
MEHEELASSFFFSRGKPGRDNASQFWPTIAFHLAMSIPKLRDIIGHAVVDNPGIFFKSLDVQMAQLIVEPLCSFQSQKSTPTKQKPYSLVIIDGLDECKDDNVQQHILHSVSSIVNTHHLPLRFMIACRPEPHIRQVFDSPDFRLICYHIALDESFYPIDDVHVFLRSEFDRIYKKHRHTMPSVLAPWPSENVVRLLAMRSGGQFICASTATKFIDDVDRRPTDQLELVLNASSSAPFTDLDQLYHQILSTIPNSTVLLRIIGCILVARRLLSVYEIETLLRLSEGDVSLVLRRMHSLLDVPDLPTESIKVLHASFGDFMFNKDRARRYYIKKEESHADMTHGCAHILKWLANGNQG